MIDVIRLPIFFTISMDSLFQARCFNCYRNKCVCCCYGHVFGGLESCRLICCSSCKYGCIFKVKLGKRSRNCHVPGQRFPRDHGMSVAPSGRVPSVRDSPSGSLATGICARLMTLHITSLSLACHCCLALLRLHDNP